LKTHDYEEHAKTYAKLGIEGTYFLAFRDINKLIKKYVAGKQALDYGCGTGRSSRLLRQFGFETIGVDISKDMLKEASTKDEEGGFVQITSSKLPFADASFDLAFSSFVFLEVPYLNELYAIFYEIKRVLKQGGHFIFITSSEDGYKGDWVSLNYDFPENKRDFVSGDKVKLQLRDTDVVLYDYYWTHEDFLGIFKACGLELVELHQPTPAAKLGVEWRDEQHLPPWSIYVLRKP
jgi:ubiquinone/menaquinone biosynthesis C-methylase UbiE